MNTLFLQLSHKPTESQFVLQRYLCCFLLRGNESHQDVVLHLNALALLVSSKITLAIYSICRDLSYNQISELSRNIFADLKGLEHL